MVNLWYHKSILAAKLSVGSRFQKRRGIVMNALTMLVMEGCPYCKHALHAVESLRAEGGVYADVSVTCIDENKEPEKAKAYAADYYYVPSIFMAGKKLYEAQPGQDYDQIYAQVRHAFDAAASG